MSLLGNDTELAAIFSRVCKAWKQTDPLVLHRPSPRQGDIVNSYEENIDVTSHPQIKSTASNPPSLSLSTSPTEHYSNHSSYSWLKETRSNKLRSRTSSSSLPDLVDSDPSPDPTNHPSLEQHCGLQVIFDSSSTLLPVFSTQQSQLQTTLFSKSQQVYLLKLFAASRYRTLQDQLSSAYIPSSSSSTYESISLQATKSFVDYRRSSDGQTKGPLAFFGSLTHSLLMTRSIGDRLGPRGCIALPDITVHTIPASKHARYLPTLCLPIACNNPLHII